MQSLELELAELESGGAGYHKALKRASLQDSFCSSLPWILSAHEGLHEPRPLRVFEHRGTYMLFALSSVGAGGAYWVPLEAMWGLSCPLIGPNPKEAVALLAQAASQYAGEMDAVLLTGIAKNGGLLKELVTQNGPWRAVLQGQECVRQGNRLTANFSDYWEERSKGMRRSLRRSKRDCAAAGIAFEEAHSMNPYEAFERLMCLEEQSWKGQSGEGINQGGMRQFYAKMLPRLGEKKSMRLLFARTEERDLGYILGAVWEGQYRGLQFCFVEEVRKLGLGNILQLEQIRGLCEEGVTYYDLGTEREYKSAWARQRQVTETLILRM